MTKEKIEGQAQMKTEEAWCSSCPVADDDNDDNCDDNMMIMTMTHSKTALWISGRK